MKVILGRKIGMSQMFSTEGDRVAVTLISAEPNKVTLRRTEAKDGYNAIQLGLPKSAIDKKENNKDSGTKKITPGRQNDQFEARREFFVTVADDVQGSEVSNFEAGDVIEIVGESKGKGFQGVVKRHGFKGGPASHGHRHVLRKGGSIGSAFPQHVIKGKRMAGRMGADRVTVKNLKIMWVDSDKHLLAIKGAVPGKPGSLVELIGVDDSGK